MNADLVMFLAKSGAEIIEPKSEWEMARFRARGQIAVVYRNSKGRVSYSSEIAEEAHEAWLRDKPFHATERVKRVKRAPQVDALIERDGTGCFFCGADMVDDDMTLEHLVPICHGGNNHPSNLALAHEACNKQAGHLSVVEKVMLRETLSRGADQPTRAVASRVEDECSEAVASFGSST